MRKTRKVTSRILCLLLCTVFFSLNVKAAEGATGDVVDGSRLTEDSESTGTWLPLARGMFLYKGTSQIVDLHNRGLIEISAETTCTRVSDKVEANIYLERYSGGSWNPVTQYYHTVLNGTYAYNYQKYVVQGGYYYRVRGGHRAIFNGVTESVLSGSDGILI